MADLRVLIVADNLLARAGLAALLEGDCVIAGQTAGGPALNDLIEDTRPDVLLYDLGWNPSNALESLSELSGVPVVALIPGEEDALVAMAALSGAYGLLLRDSEPDILLSAMEAVANGLVVLDPLFTAALARNIPMNPDQPGESLTPRENEVLQLLAQGLTNRAIAHQLKITEHTVKFHVNAIMGKLNAQSRTEAVVKATRLGLIIL